MLSKGCTVSHDRVISDWKGKGCKERYKGFAKRAEGRGWMRERRRARDRVCDKDRVKCKTKGVFFKYDNQNKNAKIIGSCGGGRGCGTKRLCGLRGAFALLCEFVWCAVVWEWGVVGCAAWGQWGRDGAFLFARQFAWG